jgi:hypothetical protein
MLFRSVAIRIRAGLVALLVGGLLSGGLVACGDDDAGAEHVIVPEGKADDYFAKTAQEYVVQGTSQVTLEPDYAGTAEADRLARARELVGYKHVVIEWFLNSYLIDKSDHNANEDYGGFKSMVKAGSYEDLDLHAVDELTYEFTFQMIVGGTNDLLSILPTEDATDGKQQFTLQMGRISNDEMARLEMNNEWYRRSPWSSFDPSTLDPEQLEPIVLEIWPEQRSTDAWIDYDRLYADQTLSIAVHFGWDYHAEYHLEHSESLYNWLVDTMGFESPVGAYEEYRRTSGPLTRTFEADGQEITARIWLYWGQPGTDTDPDTASGGITLEEDMRHSFANREVIIYSGHSGYLYGFALANWRTTAEGDLDDSEVPGLDMPADTYQLVVAEGCDTYAMGEAFWQNPNKADHENLDVITTTSFSNASSPAVVQDILRALVPRSGEHEPVTYGALLRDLDTNSYWFNTMYGVHGIDDNPALHPYADLGTLCQVCERDSQCGGVGNQCSRLNDDEKVCTAFCTDDRGCPAGYACVASASGWTIQSRQCVPRNRTCLSEPEPTGPAVILNEVLADPPMELAGDANGDGVRSFADDEFVELVNVSDQAVELQGWTLSDGVRVRHTFGAVSLAPGQALVVFGGGDPATFTLAPAAEGALVFVAEGGLGLTNTGDTVTLADAGGDTVDRLAYDGEGGNDRALCRATDADPEASFIPHPGQAFSPGTRQDGSAF